MSILQIEKLAKLNESEKIKYIQGLINQGENHSLVRKEVGRAWGIGKSARNEKFNKIIKGAVTIKDCGNKIYTVESKKKEVLKINGNTAVAEVKGIADIVTVEDLIAYAQIDTSIWECWKSSANVWNVAG
jgi:hypothetical protein